MGLERVQLGSDGDQVSIWDGHSFVFNQSSWTLVNLYRMVRRCAAASEPPRCVWAEIKASRAMGESMICAGMWQTCLIASCEVLHSVRI